MSNFSHLKIQSVLATCEATSPTDNNNCYLRLKTMHLLFIFYYYYLFFIFNFTVIQMSV